MGKRVARVLLAVVVTGSLLVFAPLAANAQLSTQPFAGYGSGTAIALNAATLGTTTVADVHAAHSGGSVDSTGLTETLNDQFGQVVQPALPDKNAYGRGSGVEVGVITANPQPTDINQIILTQIAEAAAPPPTDLITKETPINLPGILSVSLARGQAQATYDPEFCPIGRPLTYGHGYVENLSALGGLVGTSQTGNSASESTTVTYLVPNGDGTFGVVSETRQIIAPISLAGTGITIDVVGPLVMKATATGKPGDPRNGISYPGTPAITVSLNAIPLISLSLQDLLGTNGLTVNLPGVLLVTAGAPPTGLNGTGAPTVAADGTVAAAAVDAVRLQVLSLLGPEPVVDLAVGHIEAAALAPAGGVTCRIPVKKIAVPDPVPVGQDSTFVISIPSDAGLFNALFSCDLIGITAIDTVDVESGRVNFRIVSADHGGVVDTTANKVTWANLGNYVLGQPPIELRVVVHISSASGEAVIRDTVDVSATLGNCRGRAAGDDIVLGSGQITNAAMTGRFVLLTPVQGGNLAATGGTALPLVVGGAMALMALGVIRVRKLVTRRTD